METTKTKSKFSTYQLAVMALMAAVMCVLGPVSVPIGAVPISLTNLVIYFAVLLLGSKMGTLSYIVYLLLGAVGLPVFSGYAGGLAKLAGPTGGYLIGFIPMALLAGICMEKSGCKPLPTILGMVLGTLAAYLFGTVWFVFQMQCEVWYALTVCVFPFLVFDFAKILAAYFVGSAVRRRLLQANLLRGE